MKSILQSDKSCYLCGSVHGIEEHHIFAGMANRPISEKYGLKVWLCHNHHTGAHGAQYDRDLNQLLKQEAQKAFEIHHSREEWMELIRKNFLEDKNNE